MSVNHSASIVSSAHWFVILYLQPSSVLIPSPPASLTTRTTHCKNLLLANILVSPCLLIVLV